MTFADEWGTDPVIATRPADLTVDELIRRGAELNDEIARQRLRSNNQAVELWNSRDIEAEATMLRGELDQMVRDGLIAGPDVSALRTQLHAVEDRAHLDQVWGNAAYGSPRSRAKTEEEERRRRERAGEVVAAVVLGFAATNRAFARDFRTEYRALTARNTLGITPEIEAELAARARQGFDAAFKSGDRAVRDLDDVLHADPHERDEADAFLADQWDQYAREIRTIEQQQFRDAFADEYESTRQDFRDLSDQERAERIAYIEGLAHDQFDVVVRRGDASATAYEASLGRTPGAHARDSDRYLTSYWDRYTTQLHQLDREKFGTSFETDYERLRTEWNGLDSSTRTARGADLRDRARSQFDAVMERGPEAAALYEQQYGAAARGRTGAEQYLAREWQQYGHELREMERLEQEREQATARERDQRVVDDRARNLSTEDLLAAQRGMTGEQARTVDARDEEIADEKQALAARKGSALGMMPDDDNVSEGSYKGLDVTGTPDEIRALDRQQARWEDGHRKSVEDEAARRGLSPRQARTSLERDGGRGIEHEFGPKAHNDPSV